VPQDPPPLVARATGWIVLALFLAAAAAVTLIPIPEVVEIPFTLAGPAGPADSGASPVARIEIPARVVGRIRRGTRVRLVFDDYPPERFGTIDATLDTDGRAEGASGAFVASATLDRAPGAPSETRIILRVGLAGRARVEVARRPLAARWFG
jgi:hypothetical protein